jgi:hypothetical protein
MRLVTEEDNWLATTRITPRAVDGLSELPHDEREATLDVLRSPFRSNRTEKMVTQRDLWRVRVNRDVRITYRVEDSVPLVLHIGRHRVSDSFVARYQSRDEISQPLAEIEIMKNSCKNTPVVMTNGTAALALERPRPLADELSRVLSALVGQAVRDEQTTSQDLALDELDRLGAALRELEDQLAAVTLEQENMAQMPARLRDMDRALVEQRRQLEAALADRERRRATSDDLERLLAEQHELRLEVSAACTQIEEQVRRSQAARSDLQAQLNGLSAQVAALAGVVEQMRAEQAARSRGWLAWLFGW